MKAPGIILGTIVVGIILIVVSVVYNNSPMAESIIVPVAVVLMLAALAIYFRLFAYL